jgi:hypothetical protein
MKRSFHANVAFLDLLFNMLLCFVMFFAITLIHMKTEQSAKGTIKLDLDSYIMIVATWPENYSDDIDLYVRAPDGSVVFFRNKDAPFMHIDRDDLGSMGDHQSHDETSGRVYTNREIVTIRKKYPGEYVVNAHAYAKRSHDPVPVNIKVYKIDNQKIIDDRSIVFTRNGQEHTASRFIVHKTGSVNRIKNTFVPIAMDIMGSF